jgi:predicted SAM-dependent methyltransferase
MEERIDKVRFAKKVIIGAAGIPCPGWVETEQHLLDVNERSSFLQYWRPASISAFLAEHVWEHLEEESAEIANRNCFEFLEPGGWLRLAVPDGFKPDPEYVDWVRPGGTGPGAEDHKILYNYKMLRAKLERSGFRVVLLEYWDENGDFHFQDWSSADGHVRRSRRYDPRNQNRPLVYTSLIADAIRPNKPEQSTEANT